MSEPMTKFEIEDVLSSIRRLVSEDVSQKAARPDLLVLTQAHRVAESDARAGAANPAEALAEPELLDGSESPEAEEAELAEWEAAETELAGADAFFGASPAAQDNSFAEADPGRSLEDRIVGLESAISRSEEEFEPDGSEDLAAHIPRFVLRAGASRPAASDTDEADETGADETGADVAAPGMAAAEAAPELVPDDFEAELAAIAREADEAAAAADDEIGQQPPGVEAATEPDPFEVDPFAGPEEPAESAATARPDATAPTAEPDDGQADGPGNLYAAAEAAGTGDVGPSRTGGTSVEEALIDEDALREIVSELVRQELRGELGERITRNVRRLIRREIHRAMSLQELAEDED